MLHHTTYQHPTAKEWVTFIHGAGGSSAIWYKQVREFERHYNVLLIDLRGHGRSKSTLLKPLKRYSFDKISNDVLEVLDHLSINRTHFVGISLGTIVIREIAERAPERVQSMIMGGAIMKLNTRGQVLMRLGVVLKSVVPYLVLYKLFAFIIMPRANHREARLLFVREAKKLAQKEFQRWFTLASEINPLLSMFRLRDIGVPTLYIMGEEDHMFLPSIRKLAESHQTSKLFVIPACGHVVNLEQPTVFNQRAIAFLKQAP